MKRLFVSVLAVSMAVTGLHVTSYAAGDTPAVSIEAQKGNPYMSEIDKELKDFFAKYNSEKDYSKKEKLLDTAINEVQSKIDSHAHFLNVMKDGAQKEDVENKFAALNLKHSILSTVKTKEQEKRAEVAQKEQKKRSALDEKNRELRAKEWEKQSALDKKDKELAAKEREMQSKEQENELKIKELNQEVEDMTFCTTVILIGSIFWGVLCAISSSH